MVKTVLPALLVIAALGAAVFLYGQRGSRAPTAPGATVSQGADSAWKRVLESPRSPEAWANLGDAQAADDLLAEAEHSYRTAVRLGGGDGLAFARLGFLLYQRGAHAEARGLLREARRRSVEVPMLDFTIARLDEELGAPSTLRAEDTARREPASPPERPKATPPPFDGGWPGPEKTSDEAPDAGAAEPPRVEPERASEPNPPLAECELPLRRTSRRGTYLVPVVVRGVEGELIMDTGASMTVLSADYMSRIGVSEDPDRYINAMTANGRARFGTAVVPEIQIGDRVLDESRVAICSDCVEEVSDGLLGLDLQAAFSLRLDLGRGVVVYDCDE